MFDYSCFGIKSIKILWLPQSGCAFGKRLFWLWSWLNVSLFPGFPQVNSFARCEYSGRDFQRPYNFLKDLILKVSRFFLFEKWYLLLLCIRCWLYIIYAASNDHEQTSTPVTQKSNISNDERKALNGLRNDGTWMISFKNKLHI